MQKRKKEDLKPSSFLSSSSPPLSTTTPASEMSKDLTDSNDDEDREPLNPFDDGVQKRTKRSKVR